MEVRIVDGRKRRSRPGSRPVSPAEPDRVDVFTLGEVAELLRVPKTRIKNWTIGRPLRIVPRILAGQGKGSRNLYSLEDVYVFALVNQLYRDGFGTAAIKRVLDCVFLTPKLGPVYRFTLTNVKGEWAPKFFQTSGLRWENVLPDPSGAEPDVGPGFYALDVQSLVAWVNWRVQTLRRERRLKHGGLQTR